MYDPRRERELNQKWSDGSAVLLVLSVVFLFTDWDPEFFIPVAIGTSLAINIYNLYHVARLAQEPDKESDPNEGAGLGFLLVYNFVLLLAGLLRGGFALYMMHTPTE